jgi:NTP pyrophosphatase (non-canonical NTP hydrolase)
MNLTELQERALHIRRMYEKLEERNYGRHWTTEEIALGFVGDVGDLAKLIQAKNGVRAIPDADAKLAHELADCLWAIFVLAALHDVNLEAAFASTMNDLEKYINQQLNTTS